MFGQGSMGMTRRQFLRNGSLTALGSVGGLSVLLAACGGDDNAVPEATMPGTDFTGTVSLLLGTHMDPVKQIIEGYPAGGSGVTPDVEEVTTPDLRSKLTTSFLAENSPWDAAFVTAELGAELADRNWLVNASAWVEDKIRSRGTLLERGMGAVESKGATWAVPWTMGSQLLHWNAGMMEEAGLDPELPATWHETPNSWDTFVEYGKALTGERNGEQYYGYTDAWADTHVLWTWGGMLHMHGGDFLDEEGQPAWNSDAGVAATEKLHDLLHAHRIIDPAAPTYTWVFDAAPGFLGGTRGMFISWPFIAGIAAAPDSAIRSGVAPNPAVETSGSVDGSEFFGVPVFAENQDEAWRFLEAIVSPEGQRIVAMGGWASIYSDILNEPDIVAAFPFYPALAKAYEYPVDGGWSADRPRWTQFLSDKIHEVLNNSSSPREALDEAARLTVEARQQDE